MSQWPMRKLGEIFEIARGGSPRPIQNFLTDDPSGINWIMIGDATESGKYIERTAKRIKVEGASSSRLVSTGDFLLTNSMSFGRPYILRTNGCIHDGWLHLKKRAQNVDDNYFYHLLGSDVVYANFKRLAAGATVKNLNIDLVSNVSVPLPPLSEQQRIAAILDKADSLRSKRQEGIRLADEFLRAVFIDGFGNPAVNSKNLPTKRIEELCHVATGATPSRDRADFFGGPHPWVKTGEVDCPMIQSAEESITDSAIRETTCKLFPIGTVLVAMYGQGKTRGKVGMLGIPAATNQACAAILPSTNISPDFLYAQLRLMYEHLRAMGRGGNQENLNLGMIKSLEVLVPPKADVENFLSIRQRTDAMLTKAGNGKKDIERLASSLNAALLG